VIKSLHDEIASGGWGVSSSLGSTVEVAVGVFAVKLRISHCKVAGRLTNPLWAKP
jgi:hypothetical protein